jgi:hypothetical protein
MTLTFTRCMLAVECNLCLSLSALLLVMLMVRVMPLNCHPNISLTGLQMPSSWSLVMEMGSGMLRMEKYLFYLLTRAKLSCLSRCAAQRCCIHTHFRTI